MGKNRKKSKSGELNSSTDSEGVEIIEEMSDREILLNMNNKLETMEKKLSQVLMIVETQKKKIVELEKEMNIQKAENIQLKDQLESSQDMIDELQQRSRMNNVIVNGMKQEKNEDIYKVVEKLGEKMGIENPLVDVQIAHRVNSTNQAKVKPIVIRMSNSKTRDKWTAAFRKSELWKNSVYVNEHLTKRNQNLLFKTKQFKKENNYRYVWVKDCKILIRKDDKSRIFAIRNENDLKRMMPNQTIPQPSSSDDFTEEYVSAASSNFETPTRK